MILNYGILTKKNTSNKTKQVLVENELNKLKTFDSSYFIGKSHFEENGEQNYLVFQPLNKYFKIITNANTKYISPWQSKGLSGKSIKPPATGDYILNPKVNYYGTKTRLEFRGSCLKQDKSTFNHEKNTLVNCLFGAVSTTKNADIDKNKYSGYGIGTGICLLPDGGFGRNIVIFGVDMSLSAHVDNKGKDILILGRGPTQGLGEHSLTAEKMYSVNFTDHRKKRCLGLHYTGANSYLFAHSTEIIKFRAKDSNIIATPLCLGNISEDWSVDNIKDTGLNGYNYDFNVDYAISVDDIKDIHKYLMKKNNVV